MKWLAVVVAMIAAQVNAIEVVATGYGNTPEAALTHAKTAAIEQVAGTFLTGRTSVSGGNYQEKIDQYHGGLISRYEVLSIDSADGLVSTRIRADVDTAKVNTVLVENSTAISERAAEQLSNARDDYLEAEQIIKALDDPAQAFAVQTARVSYVNRGRVTDVQIEGQIVLTPKWYDDMKTVAKQMGRKIDLGSAWADALWAISALSAIANPMLPGSIGHAARAAEKKDQTGAEYAACFGGSPGSDVDECFDIRYPLERVTRPSLLRMNIVLEKEEQDAVIASFPVNVTNRVIVEFTQGSHFYFSKSAKERRFDSPGVFLYAQSIMPFQYTLTLPVEQLMESRSFRIALAQR